MRLAGAPFSSMAGRRERARRAGQVPEASRSDRRGVRSSAETDAAQEAASAPLDGDVEVTSPMSPASPTRQSRISRMSSTAFSGTLDGYIAASADSSAAGSQGSARNRDRKGPFAVLSHAPRGAPNLTRALARAPAIQIVHKNAYVRQPFDSRGRHQWALPDACCRGGGTAGDSLRARTGAIATAGVGRLTAAVSRV
jgi:hypothetical protein